MRQQILRLGKNSLIYGLGTILTRFINLLLLPLFTAYLTPVDYGVLSLLALLNMVAQPVFSLGFGAAMGPCYFDCNDPERKSSTVWTAFSILLISAAVLVFLSWIFSRQLSVLVLQSPEYAPLTLLTMVSCAISIVTIPFSQRIQFEERAKIFFVITAIGLLVSVALNIIAVVFLRGGVKGMVVSQLLGHTVLSLFFILVCIKEIKFSFHKRLVRELLKLGIPLVPGFAFFFILMQSNRYILQWFEGLEQVGVYSVGFNIGMALNLVVGALSTAWYPYFMSFVEKQDEASEIFGRVFTYYILFIGYLWLMFFIFAKPVVMIMTQAAFHDAYKIVGMAAGAIFFNGIYLLLLPGMYFQKEVAIQSIVQGIAAFISILLNILLIHFLGLMGAGIGLLVGYMLMVLCTFLWNVYKKKSYINIQYQWKRILAYCPVFILVPVICLSFPPQKIEWEIIISISCFIALTFFTFVNFSKSERSQLFRIVRFTRIKG